MAAPSQARAVEWLIGGVARGEVTESHWTDAGSPVAPGSVLKIVPALAHAIRHGGKFPIHMCGGAKNGCWSPKAHGSVDLVRGLAVSCNAYFEKLARSLSYDDVALAALELGLERPSSHDPRAWIGGSEGWRVSPVKLMGAYARLSTRARDPLVSGIIEGLLQSGRAGTAAALGGLAMAKTGTSPCAHARKLPGDGWTVAMWPPESPKRVMVMRMCGEPGSKTAGRAKMILLKNV